MKKYNIIAVLILLIFILTSCANSSIPANQNDPTITKGTEETPGEEEPTPSPTPSLPLAGVKICIDPGHQAKGNSDLEPVAPWSDEMKRKVTVGGTGSKGIPEYILNLQISLKIRDALKEAGAEVLMTRETHDVDISNKERATMANEFGAHLTLRIHLNGADNKDVNGMEIYIRGNGDGSAETKKLASYEYTVANMLLAELVEATGAKNRNVRTSDSYTGINWSEGPCLILELGYLSNVEEEEKLCDDEYQQIMADAILKFLMEFDITKR